VEDEITLELGVVEMPCGHKVGRDTIIELMRAAVNEKKCEIKCPFEACSVEWSYALCQKVACFTKEENTFFMEELNKNWILKNTKRCPGCSNAVCQEEGAGPKARCSNKKCSFGPYCFLCLRKWRGKGADCGNVECGFMRSFWQGVGTKEFQLTGLDQRPVQIEMPTHRLCPKCRTPIEHTDGCKHMTCSHCRTQFCFVCLGLYDKGWPCGGYSTYCGHVAQKQQLL
jgi:LSD1 subclass zinc finger protein